MPELDCLLRYLISDAMHNFTSGKSHIYVSVLPPPPLQWGMVLRWFYSLSPRNTFVGRKYMRSTECPSSLMVRDTCAQGAWRRSEQRWQSVPVHRWYHSRHVDADVKSAVFNTPRHLRHKPGGLCQRAARITSSHSIQHCQAWKSWVSYLLTWDCLLKLKVKVKEKKCRQDAHLPDP